MKKLTFLTCAILITSTAYAATKCVPLNSTTTCTATSYENFLGKPEWTATCTTNGKTITIKGIIGFGSSQSNMQYNHKYDSFSISSSSNGGLCYCRMISPAISGWVAPEYQAMEFGNSGGRCGLACTQALTTVATFRTALFSGLSD